MKYLVYSKDYCPYCDKAIALLKSKGLEYEKIDLTNDQKLFEELKDNTGMMTVPQIFEIDEKGNKKLIGGFDRLSEKFDN